MINQTWKFEGRSVDFTPLPLSRFCRKELGQGPQDSSHHFFFFSICKYPDSYNFDNNVSTYIFKLFADIRSDVDKGGNNLMFLMEHPKILQNHEWKNCKDSDPVDIVAFNWRYCPFCRSKSFEMNYSTNICCKTPHTNYNISFFIFNLINL